MCRCPDSHFDQSDQLTWRLYLKPPLGVALPLSGLKKQFVKITTKETSIFFKTSFLVMQSIVGLFINHCSAFVIFKSALYS